MEEIQKFQEVVELIPILGRDPSLRKIFDQQHRLDTMKHSELIAEIIEQVNVTLTNKDGLLQALTKKCQQLERSSQVLEQRLSQLEETLSTQEQTSSVWFRRKR
ncbi:MULTISPECIES: hypothetical protein [unclassified Enterococcus]|uniref:hypothetical protein n=1 Tax=unclassified Enterococcus TaxID=2608891 RepID=UPI0021595B5F|nr:MULTISPECIES: hypothetical protein [unclassified Enterococcus]